MYLCNYQYTYIHCCFPVACPELNDPMNGMLNCSFGGDGVPNVGDTCRYMCDTGYMLNDAATRICQSDSTWTGTDAVCSRGNI